MVQITILKSLTGDAYLKYLSSIYLFVTNPTHHEGILHIARQKIISNKALLVNADKSGLPQYIQSKPFMPKLWTPRGYSILKPLAKPLAVNKDCDKSSSVEIKEESPAGGDIDMLANGLVHSNRDVEMADAKELVNSSKDKRRERTVATKSKKSLYDDDHQWLGDKARIQLSSFDPA
jgi:endoribonuclease Dicer